MRAPSVETPPPGCSHHLLSPEALIARIELMKLLNRPGVEMPIRIAEALIVIGSVLGRLRYLVTQLGLENVPAALEAMDRQVELAARLAQEHEIEAVRSGEKMDYATFKRLHEAGVRPLDEGGSPRGTA